MDPLQITAYTTVSAAGDGKEALQSALLEGKGGLQPNDFGHAPLDTWIGRVADLENRPLDEGERQFECRNNRLALMALRQDGFLTAVKSLKSRVDPTRIGLFLGTSTSGILSTEQAYLELRKRGRWPAGYHFKGSHDLFSATQFVRQKLGLKGPAFSISTACSSSAKVFCDAHRFISTGLSDAAIVGGVDTLCLTTLFGFNSLELVSRQPCRPFDQKRDGISIGEAAGFMILEKNSTTHSGVALLGYGESSDAYHISTPRPDGAGARLAMEQALNRADLTVDEIDYINLHGTATPSNDRAEANSINRLFPSSTPCSSTKGWTGHTLGAAGITESIIACLAIEAGFIPGTLNTQSPDPTLGLNIQRSTTTEPVNRVLSNSFGFGGSNCSLLFGRTSC